MSKRELLESYEMEEYPEADSVEFPKELNIAFAVCGKECGNKEFIVDGQSQVCQYCGKLMFRTSVKRYALDEVQETEEVK
jgi:hypothetical protein